MMFSRAVSRRYRSVRVAISVDRKVYFMPVSSHSFDPRVQSNNESFIRALAYRAKRGVHFSFYECPNIKFQSHVKLCCYFTTELKSSVKSRRKICRHRVIDIKILRTQFLRYLTLWHSKFCISVSNECLTWVYKILFFFSERLAHSKIVKILIVWVLKTNLLYFIV